MKTIHKSVLIGCSPGEMYELVSDIARYPEFLPWCDQASIVSEHASGVVAKIGIAFGGIHQSFTTRNENVAGQEVHMQLVDGPFSELDGLWQFLPLGADGRKACKVVFTLNYGFGNALLGRLVGPVFDRIANSLVDAFVKRAEQVYQV
jgi:ribosome-associated toxin RatA of RatAB toxin-antitoxin module